VTTPSRPLTDRRIVVLTSSLAPGYNDLWDAARPHVGALKVVGARSEDPRAAQGPDVVSLPAFDLGRGLVWQHLPGLRRAVKSVRADLVHVNRELWGVATQELLGLDTRIVVHGAARGRELGFPTANLSPDSEGFIPADGVYAGWLMDAGIRYPAAISVGNNPTFAGVAQKQVEAYVLDRDIDLYDHLVEVSFVERIRGMVAFTGIEPLIVQMRDDVDRARLMLS